MSTQPIIEQFQDLAIGEKLELLGQLWDQIAQQPESIPLSDHHRRLLDERLRQHGESPGDVCDWKDVKAEAIERLASK